jgi:hypothetical protein
MEPLPYIDEHAQRVDGSPEAAWAATLEVLRHTFDRGAPVARALGCEPAHGSADFAGRPGDTLPGFRVVEAEPGRRLVLRGRHRFADYSLTLLFDGSQVRAQTHADFPGARGRLYRAMVIGTGGHRIATRRLLRQIARAAR